MSPARAARARMQRLGHRAELLAHADRLRRGDAERHRGRVRVEPQEPRAGGGRAEHPGRAGDVPAAVVVVGIDRVADAARDVDAEHERRRRPAGRVAPVCSASASAADATGPAGWMIVLRCVSSKSNVCDAMPFSKRGAADVDALAAAEERRLRRWARAPARRRAPLRPSAWRDAPIAQPTQLRNVRCASALDRVAPAARRMRRDELREDARDRRRVACRRHGCVSSPWPRQSVNFDVAFLRELRPARDVVADVAAERLGRHRHRLERLAGQPLGELGAREQLVDLARSAA